MSQSQNRPRLITLAVVAGLALALAACGGTPQSITLNSPGTTAATGISVTGMGEVNGTPDTVEVDLAVSVLADSVDEATSRAADRADALISALTAGGVAKADITTTGYSIYPEYDYSGNKQQLAGYRVQNSVVAKIRDVTHTGSVLDSVTAATGDEVTIGGLQFSIEDNEAMLATAREAAWKDALAKAQQLADLSGQPLGAATSITETVAAPPSPIYYDTNAGGAERASTPIEPGTSQVTITLQVEFAMGG
jgi:uncharacterized protein